MTSLTAVNSVDKNSCSEDVLKAVILVGGPSKGTSFRPLSLTQPKPLFPIAGQPLLYHHIAAFAKLPEMKEIFIIGFFEPQAFSSFIESIQVEFKPRVRYLREYNILGTGGGLYHFREQILRGKPSCIFVSHVDVCCAFPLAGILQQHRESPNALCTLLGTKVNRSIANNFGCLIRNQESNQVLHFVEKPQDFLSDLISCGIYCFHPSIFDVMSQSLQKRLQENEECWENCDKLQLEQDVIVPLASQNQLYVYETHEFWCQIKSSGSPIAANRFYLEYYARVTPNVLAPVSTSRPSINRTGEKNPGEGKEATSSPIVIGSVFIHPSAIVHHSSKIGPNVSISAHCQIGEGVRVRDSILLPGVELKDYSCVTNAIVGWDSVVGTWSHIEGSPENNPESLSLTHNGIKRPSITILGGDNRVEDELIIRNCIVLPHKELKSSFHNEILM